MAIRVDDFDRQRERDLEKLRWRPNNAGIAYFISGFIYGGIVVGLITFALCHWH